MSKRRTAFTLLELLAVILIIGAISAVAVSNFSFLDGINKRPPKAVFLETLKLARLAALEEGEEISLYFDSETFDIIARRTYDGSEVFRRNLYSIEDDSAIEKASKSEGQTSREEQASPKSSEDFESQLETLKKQKEREERLSALPKIELIFKPNYPEVYSFTTNDLKGVETLQCLRFAPDSTMTPANIELKIDSNSVLKFDVDVFSGFPLRAEKAKSKK